MIVVLDGEHLTIEQVYEVARNRVQVELSLETSEKVKANHELVLKLVNEGQALYGITTGIGEFSKIRITKEQSEELQKRIVYSHAAGTGNLIPEEVVRAGMLLRANVMAKGYTGVRLSTLQTVVDMLNRGVTPVIYEKGSLGTSGDLSPLAQFAEVVIGEGEAFYQGQRHSGEEAMARAGIPIVKLTYKEGLGLINGSQMFTGLGALLAYDAERLLKNAQIAAAMTIDVLKGVLKAFDPRLHAVRPFPGQNAVAANIRKLVEGSGILADRSQQKVQDGYSLRCTPQIMGPALDTLRYVREQITTEMNSVADNPIFFTADGVCLAGGNFHGQPVAAALDYLAIPMTFVGGLSERHTNRMLNPVLSGLPDFLVEGKGLNSGLMVAQYTAAALVSENKVLSHPASVDSISVSADQEDYVSMGPGAAFKLRQIQENLAPILAIQMLCAAQAADFRAPLQPGKGTGAAYREIRKKVTHLEDDRVLYPDINAIAEMVRQSVILDAVEQEVGPLQMVS
jgi:histidine ammonia-lyase